MNVSTVSTADTTATDPSTTYKQTKADFQAIAAALQSGDVTQAQTAFAQLQKDNPRLAQALSSDPSSTDSPRIADLKSLASALKSGDLAGAQKAFGQLQQLAQTGGKHHHHHAAAPAALAQTTGTDADEDNDGSKTTPGSIFQATA